MHSFDLMRRKMRLQCYPYCIGLKYDRTLKITQEQWEKEDVNVIAQLILQDLSELKISAKIVNNTYLPSAKVNILALRVGIKMMHDEYLYHTNYHIIVKKPDGYWYSKFKNLPPERLPLNIDIELWDWQLSDKKAPEKFYSSNVVYIAFAKPD